MMLGWLTIHKIHGFISLPHIDYSIPVRVRTRKILKSIFGLKNDKKYLLNCRMGKTFLSIKNIQ